MKRFLKFKFILIYSIFCLVLVNIWIIVSIGLFGFLLFGLPPTIFILFIEIVAFLMIRSSRNTVYAQNYHYLGKKYSENILKGRLERWKDYEYELSGDKVHNSLNKSIYKLEKKVIKLYIKTKYPDALDVIQHIFRLVKDNYDQFHPFFSLTITNLGRLYHDMGNFAEARPNLEKALEIRQELLRPNQSTSKQHHLDVAQSMTNLGRLYHDMGNFAEARPNLEKALEIRQEFLEPNHLDVAQSMTNLGRLYYDIDNFAEAESLLSGSLEIKMNSHDRDKPELLAIAYTDLGYLSYRKGEYDKAKEYYDNAKNNWSANADYHRYPLDAISTTSNLGILYHEIGNYRVAELYFKDALTRRQNFLGENHLLVAQSMTNLGRLYHEMGDYEKAEVFYNKSFSILLLVVGKTNVYFANLLTYYGKLYHDLINYTKAESLYKESLEILEKMQIGNQLRKAQSMTNLGTLYHDMGKYREAEFYLKNGLKIRQNFLEENHPSIAQSKIHLANLYLIIGDYSRAGEYFDQSLEIYTKENRFRTSQGSLDGLRDIFGTSQGSLDGLINLADISYQLRNKSEAIRLYKKYLNKMNDIGKKTSPGYATALNKLGEVYFDQGDFSKAEEHYKESLGIRQLIFNDASAPIAQSINNLALLFHRKHEYITAEEYYKQALTIFRTALGEKNINNRIILDNLAQLYLKTKRQNDASQLMKEVVVIDDDLLGDIFSISSERQRMAFLNLLNKNFHNSLSIIIQYFSNSIEEVRYALNLVIRRKGIGAEALAATRDAILSGKYPDMEAKLQESITIRTQIAMKTLSGPNETETLETHNKILAEWNDRKENLEADLANHIPEIRLEQKLKAVNIERIVQSLPVEAVLIDLVKFNFTDFSYQSDSDEKNEKSRYLAFVIHGDATNNIQMIDLGYSDIIDDAINKFRNNITGEKQNRNLIPIDKPKSNTSDSKDIDNLRSVLNPLLETIGNCKRIFIAPDGDFTKFPFELLRFGSSDKYMLEECLISYLTTSRDLITYDSSYTIIGTYSDSLVIADPDFDLSADEIGKSNVQRSGIFANAIPMISSEHESIFRQSRDLDVRSLNFNRLTGTREEGRLVAELIGVTPVMDQKVLESEIKSYVSPKILHIATHGFFLPNQKTVEDTNVINLCKIEPNALSRLSANHLDNPMLRSGLALAGVNTWLKKRPLLKKAEDGILTAEDVSGWNLSNTELAVLSACETGLGDVVTGEGVYGLRRAFVLAGTQTLVMSLWKVPDQQTKELMVDFYKRLLSGKPRAEALREAQLAMKDRYQDPYYWGAFICQGNPGPLSNSEISKI